MDDERDQRNYFGTVLRPKGYVPVFLVIENQRSSDSFLLKKDSMAAIPAGRAASMLRHPASSPKRDKALSVAAAVPTVYSLLATAMVSRAKDLKLNFLKKELQSVTLSPGTSAHGFVFVPAHWSDASRDRIELTIPFTLSGSNETVIVSPVF